MNNVTDMESVEEMIRFLEIRQTFVEVDDEGEDMTSRPFVFIGQLNERTEDGMMRVNIVVTVKDEDELIRYLEPVGVAPFPMEDLAAYDQMKKEFDMLLEKVDAQKKKMTLLFTEKNYPVFAGVSS